MPGSRRSSRLAVRCSVLLVWALAASSLAAAAPRWVPVGPPAVPLWSRLFLDPAGVGGRGYALTAAGLWRSMSLGSWRSIQVGLDGMTQAFASDPHRPGRLYAVVLELDDSTSIRRSDDFGDHWSVVSHSPYGSSYSAQDLQVDPFAPDTVYWLSDSVLFRSQDGGRTWQDIQYGTVFALAPDRPGTLYSVSGAGFYTSVDGGTTWSEPTLFEGPFSPQAMVATRAPRTLYVWARDPGPFSPCFVRSSDEGATWKPYLQQTHCGAPAIDPNDPLTVRVVVLSGMMAQLWVSRDGGESWTNAGEVPGVGDVYNLPGKGLALATDKGVFRAATDQGPWQPVNHGFAAAEIGAILPIENGLLAAPVVSPYASRLPVVPLLVTSDLGRTWSGSTLSNPIALAADPGDPRHVIASAVRFEEGGISHARVLETLDGGGSWKGVVDPQVERPWDLFRSLAVDPFDRRTLYAGNLFGGFHRSDDGGRTWHDLNAGLLLGGCHHYYCDSNWVSAILPDPRKSGTVAILFERQVYASVDRGSNWQRRGPSPRPRYGSVVALTREPQGALVAVLAQTAGTDADRLGVIFRSTDEGLTWTQTGRLPRVVPSGRVQEVTGILVTPAGLFVGTNFLGVLRSTNGGRTWTSLGAGLPLPAVSSLVVDPVDPTRFYAAVPQNGIYTIQVAP
ncbi:MAG TPA: sialidase family protein [Thermoanaerobaculia bacterium]|nr:sialidase family protein [Thermoanaerobaculia bacterium]